ncbi:hypothetical protein SAMN05444166_1841 [Singulisphaera sp. GP187]|uniref:DUF167 domain-containing protein n=1 Tax=Singulisphaera sp. GP187 TaxID=1882752 RepID=UPI000929F114|nr:DUF167 domain-containing protein [Singulisphaera sp. GP187]SIN97054.1 hypothetical protein SAMN05444166_1841 [Singulisphaera sp. GP187]
MIELTDHPRGTVLPVRARPGARKNAILGEHAGSLRVAVATKPEGGKANVAILGVLAQALGFKTSQIDLLSGQTSREKRFLIVGQTIDEVRGRLDALTKEQV